MKIFCHIRVKIGLMFCLIVAGVLTGCQSSSVSDKRLVRYRPEINDRGGIHLRQSADRTISDVLGTNAMVRSLNRGDTIIVELRGIPIPEKIQGEVDDSGFNLPLIGRVRIDGKTTFQAEKLIEKAYIDGGYYTKINVIIIKQADEYFVTGEVNKQDKYFMIGDRTLLQAITAAGGYTDFAKKNRVKVMRGRGKDKQILFFDCEKIELGKDKDPLIKPGDIIEVPRRLFL